MTKAGNRTDYLTDPKQWQAYSHPELANTKPEGLFQVSFAERYKSLHKDLWWRVMRVNGTLFTLEQLSQFPFAYLYAPNEMEFWTLIYQNCFDIVCLMLHGLATDTASDAHSLKSFRNEIVKAAWLRSDKLELFKQTLRERKFDERVESIAERVQAFRNSFIAHRLKDTQSGLPREELAGVTVEELRHLFDAVHFLFGALSFGSAYCTLAGDLLPCTVGGELTPTCLDRVLDAVLRDSDVVNAPERSGKCWPKHRKHRKPDDLRVMNELRKRIGLPEA